MPSWLRENPEFPESKPAASDQTNRRFDGSTLFISVQRRHDDEVSPSSLSPPRPFPHRCWPHPRPSNRLLKAIKAPGLTVVHLWAPWCSNCQAELKSGGWTKTVKENPEVKFYFVSVWNSGEDGRAMLAKYEIAQQPNVTILADPGPRGADHIKQFAGLPLKLDPHDLDLQGRRSSLRLELWRNSISGSAAAHFRQQFRVVTQRSHLGEIGVARASGV